MVRILDLENYAHENNIPIMLSDGIEILLKYIKENNIKYVLEIGSAIGYSAIRMSLVDKDIKVTTIERDEERYQEAIKNIGDFGLENQINIIFNDAFEVELDDKYDLIFIDAAKAQSIKFFEKFERNLNPGGVIVTDNLEFHGLVKKKEEEIESRNLRALVRKVKEYINFLKANDRYETEFLSIGDGISVSKKIENK